MTSPAQIMHTLETVGQELAVKGNAYAEAADAWTRKRAERKQKLAEGFFLSGESSIEAKKKDSERAYSTIGVEEEARYEMLKAEVEILSARAIIGQALLKAQ